MQVEPVKDTPTMPVVELRKHGERDRYNRVAVRWSGNPEGTDIGPRQPRKFAEELAEAIRGMLDDAYRAGQAATTAGPSSP